MGRTLERDVQPEWLDALPADDPRALRSRRDLRRINALMGNARWMLGVLARHADLASGGVLELGAGDGALLARVRRDLPRGDVCGLDLAPRPDGLPASIGWQQSDVRDDAAPFRHAVLMANLFLHHLHDAQLARLGRRLDTVRLLVTNEPHRAASASWGGRLLWPLIHPVTRHDMHASIRAGFRRGELPRALRLDPAAWDVHEHVTLRGACRLVARRRPA